MPDHPDGPRLTPPVSEQRDHVRGPASAPVTLVEFADFQCSYCGQAHPIVEAVRQHFGDDLRMVFRHFPMTQVHPLAFRAAEATEAAGAQGRLFCGSVKKRVNASSNWRNPVSGS